MAADVTSAAAAAAGAGIGAMVLSTLGVDTQSLVWGGMGAIFGSVVAPPAGRLRAAATFASVVMLSAVLGTWAGHEYLSGTATARNAVSAALGMFFHPLFTAVVTGIPQVVAAFITRWGGAK